MQVGFCQTVADPLGVRKLPTNELREDDAGSKWPQFFTFMSLIVTFCFEFGLTTIFNRECVTSPLDG